MEGIRKAAKRGRRPGMSQGRGRGEEERGGEGGKGGKCSTFPKGKTDKNRENVPTEGTGSSERANASTVGAFAKSGRMSRRCLCYNSAVCNIGGTFHIFTPFGVAGKGQVALPLYPLFSHTSNHSLFHTISCLYYPEKKTLFVSAGYGSTPSVFNRIKTMPWIQDQPKGASPSVLVKINKIIS